MNTAEVKVEWEAVAIGVLQSSPPPDPAAGPRWHLVSYAEGEPYASLQRAMEEGHRAPGFVSHRAWNLSALLASPWYARNRATLRTVAADTGNIGLYTGFQYAFKPYVVLAALLAASDGDYVLYQDSSKY